MTVKLTTENHKDYYIFPVIAFVYHIKEKEFIFEIGLIKYTLTIQIK